MEPASESPDPATGGAPEPVALRAQASAPGKVILFGEHAAVYGEPAVSVALSLRTTVAIHTVGQDSKVNGYPLNERHHLYIVAALRRVWPEASPLRIFTESQVPSASGTGSSAALATATTGALAKILGRFSKPYVAQNAFDAEYDSQGAASPNDTSCSTAGGGTVLSGRPLERLGDPLWRVARRIGNQDRTWHVYGWQPPKMHLVVGVTQVKSKTAEQIAKVRTFVTRSAFGTETIRDAGRVASAGVEALDAGDLREVGRLMDANQNLLHTMGVCHPANQALIDAARAAPGTLGAKITGAGGGGSIVVLTDQPEEAARALTHAGGRAIPVTASHRGVEIEDVLLEAPPPGAPQEEPA